MEHIYDSLGNLHGYVGGNMIYDADGNVIGYTDGYMLFDGNGTPLGYAEDGYAYTMDDDLIGMYDGNNRLFDMSGRYLGYGNQGFGGLLGAILFFLLLRRAFRPRIFI